MNFKLLREFLVLCFLIFPTTCTESDPPSRIAPSTLESTRGVGPFLAQRLRRLEKVDRMKRSVADSNAEHYGKFMRVERKLLATPKGKESKYPEQGLRHLESGQNRIVDKIFKFVQTLNQSSNAQATSRKSADPDIAKNDTFRENNIENAVRDVDVAASQSDFHSMEEGRKHKGKHKGIAYMSGMMLVAMLIQMFVGKVILIAGAAFVMAKIALIISLLTSVKKCHHCSHSGGAEHVVVSSSGHGYTGETFQRGTQNGFQNLL